MGSAEVGPRIAAATLILVASLVGAVFPLYVWNRQTRIDDQRQPGRLFFAAKYFGTGVIFATALIHLLAPAHEAFESDLLLGWIPRFAWVETIVAITVVIVLAVDVAVLRQHDQVYPVERHEVEYGTIASCSGTGPGENAGLDRDCGRSSGLAAVATLEFGVVFHSFFVGLSVAMAQDSELAVLAVAVSIHQLFEGLGLGSRLAERLGRGRPGLIRKPCSSRTTTSWLTIWGLDIRYDYLLAAAFAASTPIAVLIGTTAHVLMDDPNLDGHVRSRTGVLVTGVSDAVAGGILIYTALVELIGLEIVAKLTCPHVQSRDRSGQTPLEAVFWIAAGAACMTVLGIWV